MAIGCLGWSEEQALKSDVRAIILGYEGWCDQRDGMARIIYRSQGAKVEDPPPRWQVQKKPRAAENFRRLMKEHNATFERRSGVKPLKAR